jgi:hypothetical protein
VAASGALTGRAAGERTADPGGYRGLPHAMITAAGITTGPLFGAGRASGSLGGALEGGDVARIGG